MSVNVSIADGLPKSCSTPRAERRRRAFVGYDNLPHDTDRQPLRVYVHDSHDRAKMRLGVNEFQTLVNCLPMATVCSEARSHAADFCRAKVKLLNLFYTIDAPDEPSRIGDEILEPVFMQPTTVMVTYAKLRRDGPVGFHSAEHLVHVVNHVFGSRVERIILSPWFNSYNTLRKIYWPHTVKAPKIDEIDPIFIHDPSHDQSSVFMTPERILHVEEEFFYNHDNDMQQVFWHLLKFHELLHASTKRLPRLRSIELELHTYCWDDVLLTRINATNKNGSLWLHWGDFNVEFDHNYTVDYGTW